MRKLARVAAAAGALAWVAGGELASAQEELRFELFRPRLEITTEGVSQSDLEDFDGDLLQRRTEVRFNLPLGPVHVRPESKLFAYQMFAQANLSASPIELVFPDFEIDRTLYTGALRLSGLMASQAGNFYLASLGASMAEDEETIDSPDVQFSALGLGTHSSSDAVTLIYGGAVGFNEQKAVPLFGVLWRFRPEWTLFTVLPFTVRTTYDRSERTKLHFLIEATGNRNRFANEALFPGRPETIYFRSVGAKLGAEWEFRPNEDHVFLVQAGVVGGRELKFSLDASDDPFLSTGIDGAGYLKLGWRVSFGESFLEKIEAAGAR